MATEDQIKALLRSHFDDDYERFYAIVSQVAANEAKRGHFAEEQDIAATVDGERKKRDPRAILFPKDLQGLVFTEEPHIQQSALVTSPPLTERIDRIIRAYRDQDKSKAQDLKHRRILLVGPPGTGKAMTARVFAKALAIPLYGIPVDRLVTEFMGETSAKLRQIFDLIQNESGVYLFDAFDAIGGVRSKDQDRGEMRGVLRAFLECIEQDSSDGLIVAATSNPSFLDQALFTVFDDILFYQVPSSDERRRVIFNAVGQFLEPRFFWERVLEESDRLSHKEVHQACEDAIRKALLMDQPYVFAEDLLIAFSERKTVDSLGS